MKAILRKIDKMTRDREAAEAVARRRLEPDRIAEIVDRIAERRDRQRTDPSNGPDRLREIEDELRQRFDIVRLNAFEIGRLYFEAKQILGHGKFGKWCKEFGVYGKSSAEEFMNIYRCCLGRPELAAALPKTYLRLICAPKFPVELREEIFKHGKWDGTLEDLKHLANVVAEEGLSPDHPVIKKLLGSVVAESRERRGEKELSRIVDKALAYAKVLDDELERLLHAARDGNDGDSRLVRKIERRRTIFNKVFALQP